MLKSTEQDSSQEGLNVSPISDTKWVTEFDWWNRACSNWTLDTGKADTKWKDNCRWPTQTKVGQLLNIWMTRPMIWQHWLKDDTWKHLVIKSNERQTDFPNQLRMMNRGCHVQERHLLPINSKTKHIPFPNFFPHHFWQVPLYFYASLKRITYACWCKLILRMSPSEYF